MIIETNQRAYMKDKEYVLLAELESEQWQLLSVGWKHNLWEVVGERGGLAEAGEINFPRKLSTSIEAYISRYRKVMDDAEPLENLFSDFNVSMNGALVEEASIFKDASNLTFTPKKKLASFIEEQTTLF